MTTTTQTNAAGATQPAEKCGTHTFTTAEGAILDAMESGEESPATVETSSIYHPGAQFAALGRIEQWLTGGGVAIRYEHLHGGPSTVADFTAREAVKLGLKGGAK